MARITEGECPIAVRVFIETEAKKRSISKKKMTEIYSNESGTPFKTVEGWVYPRKTNVTNDATHKPTKKHTKPEIKTQLVNIKKRIDSGEVSDDDLKTVLDTVAKKISEKTVAPRVAAKVSTAFKKSSSHSPVSLPKKSKIEVMINTFHKFLEQVDAIIGEGNKNLSKNDQEILDDEFKLMVPRALRLFDWMGIDLQELLTNYVSRYKEAGHEKQNTKRLLSGRQRDQG